MNTELQIERQRLMDLGCAEFKSIASKIGQKYRSVIPWQCSKLESGTVLEVVGYWQVENGNGYKISVYGDDLVMLTNDDREPDIYTQHGFTMAELGLTPSGAVVFEVVGVPDDVAAAKVIREYQGAICIWRGVYSVEWSR